MQKSTNATESDGEFLRRVQDYMAPAEEIGRKARVAFRRIRRASTKEKNDALRHFRDALRRPDEQEKIIAANHKDLENADAVGLSTALRDRLALDKNRIEKIASSLDEIIALPDPVGETLEGRRLPSGLEMVKKRTPLGVVFTVYESRPNVTADIGALCLKSGNVAILRGGKEAQHSNAALYLLLRDSLESCGLPGDSVLFIKETDRAFMQALLQMDEYIDLAIPRGGTNLISFVSKISRIPLIKHDKGVCNLYVDQSANYETALKIIANSKLQRPSVCNALENLLIHTAFPHTGALLSELNHRGAALIGCARSHEYCKDVRLIATENEDAEYSTEYSDNRLSVKIVDSADQAFDFIYRYGSGHSEAIVAEDQAMIERFLEELDSAGLFVNCSTRFHDGGEMGMGAEVGISTGRMHVRGPMGLRDLTTSIYVMRGQGHIRQ